MIHSGALLRPHEHVATLRPMDEQHSPLDISPEQMREMGYLVIDRLVDRHANMRAARVWTGATRADLDARLHDAAPAAGVDFQSALGRLFEDVLTFGARVDHPRFMAFVPGAPTWPAVLGDLIAAGTNTFQGTWLASSGASTLELVVIDWFKDWLHCDAAAAGLLVSGGSVANLTALATARLARCDLPHDRATLYWSTETHSSVLRAARTLGFPDSRIIQLPVDAEQRIDPGELRSAIERDRAAGLVPLAVVANAGTTSTGSVDDMHEIANVCADVGAWLHVDAAYGGFAVLTERGAAALRGIERADSIALDPHKWLYQPFEVGCLLVRDPTLLDQAFGIMPPYLQDTTLPAHDPATSLHKGPLPVNFASRGIQLTRAARAFKIWLSIQTLGLDAFRSAIDRCLDLAAWAEQRIAASSRLEIVTPARLGIVCFRIRADHDLAEKINRAALDSLIESGHAMISSTRVDGHFTLRICVLNYRTGPEDSERVIAWFESFAMTA
ncbi:aminotransferase class I/II-fold pyridoxal phosphate-dependent enzyme [soil metagenome]